MLSKHNLDQVNIMRARKHEMLLTLRRTSPAVDWGFSLVGGSDVNAQLIVTRVHFTSPSDGILQRGDIITKVGSYDSRDIRHQDAQTLFNAGNEIHLVVQRDINVPVMCQSDSAESSHTHSQILSNSPVLPHRDGFSLPTTAPLSPTTFNASVPTLTPYYGTPFTPLDNYHFNVYETNLGGLKNGHKSGINPDRHMHVVNQPYRTTPLVLPGAKVTRDSGHTESYLRHHPNPIVRAPPHQIIDHDRFLKDKIVHKQFNSPIGLYSDSNIADTVYKQTAIKTGLRAPMKYNPEESETYKAICEDLYGGTQEIVSGPQSKVFVPNKVPAAKKPGPVYSLPPRNVNPMGDTEETIHQSGSFKRLMYHVMAESNY